MSQHSLLGTEPLAGFGSWNLGFAHLDTKHITQLGNVREADKKACLCKIQEVTITNTGLHRLQMQVPHLQDRVSVQILFYHHQEELLRERGRLVIWIELHFIIVFCWLNRALCCAPHLHQMERLACGPLLLGVCNLEWSPLGTHAAAEYWCHTEWGESKKSEVTLCQMFPQFHEGFVPLIRGGWEKHKELTWFVMTSNSMIHPGLAVDCWLTMLNTSPTSF